MERRSFFGAIAAFALGCNEKMVGPKGPPPKPTPLPGIANGHLLQWSECSKRYEWMPRTWKLGERAYIDHFGWCVCVCKGTDETARWRRCEPPVGIYNLSEA